jgi:hypothetical protein
MPNEIRVEGQETDDSGVKNDLLANLLDDEISAAEGNNTPVGEPSEDFKALQAQVEELERERAGLLKAKQAETRKRQESIERLSQLEGAVSGILSQRQQQGMESVTENQAADARKMGIPVNYDDDGNGWIDRSGLTNVLSEYVTPYEKRINELETMLQQTSAANVAQTQAEKIKASIIGEDERYGAASGRYRAARKWVEDVVQDYATANGINTTINSGEALSTILDSSYRAEFAKQFPGLDIIDITIAEDSEDLFRRALGNIASTLDTKEEENLLAPKGMDSRFQKVMNKPSTLGNQANAKAGQLSVLEKVGNLKTQDIMELSDAQIDALLKLASTES